MVARIAVDTGFPPEIVRESYLTAIAELSVDARVHVYLPLFAAKRTIARIRRLQSESVVPLGLDPDRDGITSRTHIAVAGTIPHCPPSTSLAPPATGGWIIDLGGAQWYQRL
ncbi:DUF3562 domain-containing protein (plasmid) [Cupriavidus sp. KK10]|jgi:hypothetical protein|uniref:DUF3562 domain-containing protein n=1 Tax=Cupriavidus sp. KK10 TaxID=1478019 RepID=UPI001BAD2B35|nr:DUF3562 domain-containing protein [Cupriavidus sp. KK10]